MKKTLSALLAASLLAASLVPAAAEEVDVSRLTPIWGSAAAAPAATPVVEGRQTVPVVTATATHPTAPLSTAERYVIDHNAAEGD